MVDLTKSIAKFTSLPWRGGLAVLGLSFVLASVSSTIIGHFVIPVSGKTFTRPGFQTSNIAVPNPSASLNQAAVDMILKRNLFNSEGATGEDSAAKPAEDKPADKSAQAVKSDLPVKLHGTIYGGDPLTGIAMIENVSKRTINSFLVGDNLLKDAVVKEIHKERVIIDRNGRLEYIEVEKTELSRSRRKKKSQVSSASQGIAPIATEPPPSTFKEDGFERKEKEISMTQAYRNKLLTTDFTKVLQDVKASPNIVDGELKGFVLTRIRKDSIYEKAGFQNNDIIEEINGIPLTDTAQAIRLLQSLRNESEIEVRITRGGSASRFTLQVR